jgi:hypothetical protein
MFDGVTLILVTYGFVLPVLLLTAPLILCFIRLLNETLLDKQWRVGERSPAEQAALLDWEQSIRDFHRCQSALCFPPEVEKSEERTPDTGICPHGPSAFQERRRLF